MLVVLVSSLVPHVARADATPRKDARIKAAYIYNFIKFVSWPDQGEEENPRADVTVCAYGRNPLDGALEEIDGKETAHGVIRVVTGDPRPSSQHCHVAYFSDLERTVERFAFGENLASPVLTISGSSGFRERGGIVEFEQVGAKIGFSINIEAAQEVDLKISSKLLLLSTNKGR